MQTVESREGWTVLFILGLLFQVGGGVGKWKSKTGKTEDIQKNVALNFSWKNTGALSNVCGLLAELDIEWSPMDLNVVAGDRVWRGFRGHLHPGPSVSGRVPRACSRKPGWSVRHLGWMSLHSKRKRTTWLLSSRIFCHTMSGTVATLSSGLFWKPTVFIAARQGATLLTQTWCMSV